MTYHLDSWSMPVHGWFEPTSDPDSFRRLTGTIVGLPLPGHPGSFGHVRKNHIHEGVDLYQSVGTTAFAVETGIIVAIENFTGEWANPPSPWWNNTSAVLIEGPSGVVVYGEIATTLKVGDKVLQGYGVGKMIPVLKKDKGRPMTMLHLELHKHGTRRTYEWINSRPKSLLDPTPYLLRTVWTRGHIQRKLELEISRNQG